MMITYEQLKQQLGTIESQIKYSFQNKNLLLLSFIHRSFCNENRDKSIEHNERLEFLGDSVLGLIVSDFLYSSFPDYPEGDLSYLRSRLVESLACKLYLKKIQVENFLMVGKGESMNEGKGRGSILADLFEALIGAIYLDGGLKAVHQFFHINFENEVRNIIKQPHRNWKAELQDHFQKSFKSLLSIFIQMKRDRLT